jgi:hypothetical protein
MERTKLTIRVDRDLLEGAKRYVNVQDYESGPLPVIQPAELLPLV